MAINLGFNLNIGGGFNMGGGGFNIGGGGFGFGGPSMSMGLNFGGGDGFNASMFLNEGCGSPLGGLGFGLNNPMMGLSSMNMMGCDPLMSSMALLGGLSQMFGGQGCGCPYGGGGYPGGGGFPQNPYQAGFQQGMMAAEMMDGMNQMGGRHHHHHHRHGGPDEMGGIDGRRHHRHHHHHHHGGPGEMGGPGRMNKMGEAGRNEGVIQLTKGNSFTTPGGCTINWQGDTVNFSDPNGGGGAQAHQNTQGPGPSRFFNCGRPGEFSGEQNGKQENWKVWGDPHIQSPNGKSTDFKEPGAEFTLSDGTKVITSAATANGVVEHVQIVLPGAQPQWGGDTGADPNHTTVYKDINGEMTASGTASQYMMGGFQQQQHMYG